MSDIRTPPHDERRSAAAETGSLPRILYRAPIFLCIAYVGINFYGKALGHLLLDIPHIDDVEPYIPRALWTITLTMVPVFALLLIAPISRPTRNEPPTVQDYRRTASFCLITSLLMVSWAIAARGPAAATTDFYGNRLFVEHGIPGFFTVLLTPFIIATAALLAQSPGRLALPILLIVCGIWGVFLSKGTMLVYPLLVYFGFKAVKRGVAAIAALGVLGCALITAVVVLGRLRSGASLSEITDGGGLQLLALFALYRIDQLDSFALVLENSAGLGELSLSQEVLNSFLYYFPRDYFPDKPLAYSVEMTRDLRPLVFITDAANNFSLFSQAHLLAGNWGPMLSGIILLAFFSVMAMAQRLLFRSYVQYWAFNVAALVPCFISLISAGFFREYVLIQAVLAIPGLLLFRSLLSRRTPSPKSGS